MQLTRLLAFVSLALGAVAMPAVRADTEYGVGAPGFKNVEKASKPLKIVLTNDDSWASANIRATYYALRSAGHKVLVVAPAHQQSGTGGTVQLPTSKTLAEDGEHGSIQKGAPFSGKNDTDDSLRYFDGTPAACSLWALDHEAAEFFNASKDDPLAGIDLQVSGPNEGQNVGPFTFTLSGTVGATYTATERGIPAIAFSADSNPRSYADLNVEDSNDESVLIATQTANFVSEFVANSKDDKGRVLPYGIGLNVNYSPINEKNCTDPKWTATRLTGSAKIDRLTLNETSGLPVYEEVQSKAINVCNSGDCSLPGETGVVATDKCAASVSIFTTDYDASVSKTRSLSPVLQSIIGKLNGKADAKRK